MILDILRLRFGSARTLDTLPNPDALDAVHWVNVLVSLSADQMYRRKMHAQIQRRHVLWSLFKDDEFPRSFMHCLNALEESLGTLNNPQGGLLAVREVVATVDRTDVGALGAEQPVALDDRLQIGLGTIHKTIARMYFLPETPAV